MVLQMLLNQTASSKNPNSVAKICKTSNCIKTALFCVLPSNKLKVNPRYCLIKVPLLMWFLLWLCNIVGHSQHMNYVSYLWLLVLIGAFIGRLFKPGVILVQNTLLVLLWWYQQCYTGMQIIEIWKYSCIFYFC